MIFLTLPFDIIFPCLIRLYKLELETRTKHIETGKIIRKVATHLCSFDEDRIEEIEKFSEYLIHPDFVIELLRKMTELMENYKDRNDILAGNVLYFLQAISDVFPEEVTSDMNMSSRSSISTKVGVLFILFQTIFSRLKLLYKVSSLPFFEDSSRTI